MANTHSAQTLKTLHQAEAKAWRVMMYGPEADACSLYGKEGKNYLAWCKAADACYDYRQAYDLIRKRGLNPAPRSSSTPV